MLRLVEEIGGASSWLPGGKKDLGHGIGDGSKVDCWPQGGRLVNWEPFLFYKCSFKYFFLHLEAYHTFDNILLAANIYCCGYSH